MHTICRLPREQPVCKFKAKTLILLRTNETTQTTIFSIDNKNALILKTPYTTSFSWYHQQILELFVHFIHPYINPWPLIKAYCVNVVVDIKPIYLNKRYLFQNKIYYLDKICFCFAKTMISKLTLYKLN